MKGAVLLLIFAATVTGCSAVNVREVSREAANLVRAPASDVAQVHGEPDFRYVEPTAPETRYLGYLLDASCGVTFLVQDEQVAAVVPIGPGCYASTREPRRADWAVSGIKGTHISEILLTLFGVPDSSDLDTSGTGVLSYELGAESKRRKPSGFPPRPTYANQEPQFSFPQPCAVDIALSNGVAIGGWTKGGGCKDKEF